MACKNKNSKDVEEIEKLRYYTFFLKYGSFFLIFFSIICLIWFAYDLSYSLEIRELNYKLHAKHIERCIPVYGDIVNKEMIADYLKTREDIRETTWSEKKSDILVCVVGLGAWITGMYIIFYVHNF